MSTNSETLVLREPPVEDWESFAHTLQLKRIKHLDLRYMKVPDLPEDCEAMWTACVKALSKVDTLVKIDLCRCTSNLLEHLGGTCSKLEYLSSVKIRGSKVDINRFNCKNVLELRLKGQQPVEITNVTALLNLGNIKSLSLTGVKNMSEVIEVVGRMTQLESLELGDMTSLKEEHVIPGFSQLDNLRRLRLETGQQGCPTDAILQTIIQLPSLTQLELIFDLNGGFYDVTNRTVLEGVHKLKNTLNHFVWVVTLEVLRKTAMTIGEWGEGKTRRKRPLVDYFQIRLAPNPKKPNALKTDVLDTEDMELTLSRLLPNARVKILKVAKHVAAQQTLRGGYNCNYCRKFK